MAQVTLSDDHLAKLHWFADNAGKVVPYSLLDELRLVTKAKGIFKPTGTDLTLSVRQVLGSSYKDDAVVEDDQGNWTFNYAQEGSNPEDRDTYYTNRGLVDCIDYRVPVGVMIQINPKPNTLYRVVGLGRVEDWEDGQFIIRGPAEVPSATTLRRRSRRYWAFAANPATYDIERAIATLAEDTWTVKQFDVQAGDRAIIWKSKGRSDRRGIVALAEVLSDPEVTASANPDYWIDSATIAPEERVNIRYIRPAGLPIWEDGQDRELLRRLSVSRATGGSVFKVDGVLWDRVMERAGGWVESDTVEIDVAQAAEALAATNAFDPTSVVDAREKLLREVALRRGQPKFRAELMAAYEGRCAITGCDVPEALEAAHIVPYRGPTTNHVSNGLLLRADIHTLFDLGLISVDEEMRVVVSERLANSQYGKLARKAIRLPSEQGKFPSRSALAEHRSIAHI
jgi:hypothetical protein